MGEHDFDVAAAPARLGKTPIIERIVCLVDDIASIGVMNERRLMEIQTKLIGTPPPLDKCEAEMQSEYQAFFPALEAKLRLLKAALEADGETIKRIYADTVGFADRKRSS